MRWIVQDQVSLIFSNTCIVSPSHGCPCCHCLDTFELSIWLSNFERRTCCVGFGEGVPQNCFLHVFSVEDCMGERGDHQVPISCPLGRWIVFGKFPLETKHAKHRPRTSPSHTCLVDVSRPATHSISNAKSHKTIMFFIVHYDSLCFNASDAGPPPRKQVLPLRRLRVSRLYWTQCVLLVCPIFFFISFLGLDRLG